MRVIFKFIVLFCFIFIIPKNAVAQQPFAQANASCPFTEQPHFCSTTDERCIFEEWRRDFYTKKDAQSDQFDKLIRAHLTGNYNVSKILSSAAKLGSFIVIPYLLLTSFIHSVLYVHNRRGGGGAAAAASATANPPNRVAMFTVAEAAILACGHIFVNVCASFKDFYNTGLALSPTEGLREVHDQLQKLSTKAFKRYPKQMQAKLSSFDTRIAKLLHADDTKAAERCLRRREEVYFSLPTDANIVGKEQRNKGHHYGNKHSIPNIINKRIEDLIDDYPTEGRTDLHFLAQTVINRASSENGSRTLALLHGPSGTGKTAFIDGLGQALGLHVCRIQLSAITKQSHLLGPDHEDDSCELSSHSVLGTIGSCFLEAGIMNPIIVFEDPEEFFARQNNKDLQSNLLKILQFNKVDLQLKGIGISIDPSRATYIFASRKSLVTSERFVNMRINVIEFKEFTEVEKRAAAIRIMKNEVSSLNLDESKERETLEANVSHFIDYILTKDKEAQTPGASLIQEIIQDLIVTIRSKERTTHLTIDTKKTEDNEFFKDQIDRSFNRRAVVNP